MRAIVATVAALMLVACGSREKDADNRAAGKAGGDAAEAGGGAAADGGAAGGAPAPAGPAMQPGQWEMVTQVTSFDMPDAPPRVQAQLRAQQGQTQTNRICITPEQAANPSRDLVGGGRQGANCQFADSTFAGGVIRIRATCRQGGGPTQVAMAMEGGFTPTTIDARLSVTAAGPNTTGAPGTQTMRAGSIVRGRRIGDCPAGSQRRSTR